MLDALLPDQGSGPAIPSIRSTSRKPSSCVRGKYFGYITNAVLMLDPAPDGVGTQKKKTAARWRGILEAISSTPRNGHKKVIEFARKSLPYT